MRQGCPWRSHAVLAAAHSVSGQGPRPRSGESPDHHRPSMPPLIASHRLQPVSVGLLPPLADSACPGARQAARTREEASSFLCPARRTPRGGGPPPALSSVACGARAGRTPCSRRSFHPSWAHRARGTGQHPPGGWNRGGCLFWGAWRAFAMDGPSRCRTLRTRAAAAVPASPVEGACEGATADNGRWLAVRTRSSSGHRQGIVRASSGHRLGIGWASGAPGDAPGGTARTCARYLC